MYRNVIAFHKQCRDKICKNAAIYICIIFAKYERRYKRPATLPNKFARSCVLGTDRGRKIALRYSTETITEWRPRLRRETGAARVCRTRGTSSPPLLNYYLTSLYQVRRGGNATVVRQCRRISGRKGGSRRVWRALGTTTTTPGTNEGNRAHGSIPLLLYILLPDVDSTDLHKEMYAVVTSVDCERDCGDVRGMFPSCVLYHLGDVACRLSRRT